MYYCTECDYYSHSQVTLRKHISRSHPRPHISANYSVGGTPACIQPGYAGPANYEAKSNRDISLDDFYTAKLAIRSEAASRLEHLMPDQRTETTHCLEYANMCERVMDTYLTEPDFHNYTHTIIPADCIVTDGSTYVNGRVTVIYSDCLCCCSQLSNVHWIPIITEEVDPFIWHRHAILRYPPGSKHHTITTWLSKMFGECNHRSFYLRNTSHLLNAILYLYGANNHYKIPTHMTLLCEGKFTDVTIQKARAEICAVLGVPPVDYSDARGETVTRDPGFSAVRESDWKPPERHVRAEMAPDVVDTTPPHLQPIKAVKRKIGHLNTRDIAYTEGVSNLLTQMFGAKYRKVTFLEKAYSGRIPSGRREDYITDDEEDAEGGIS